MCFLETYLKGQAACFHALRQGWGYVVMDDRGRTMRELRERTAHPAENEFVQRAAGMTMRQLVMLRREMGIPFMDSVAAFLRHDLAVDAGRREVVRLPDRGSWLELLA